MTVFTTGIHAALCRYTLDIRGHSYNLDNSNAWKIAIKLKVGNKVLDCGKPTTPNTTNGSLYVHVKFIITISTNCKHLKFILFRRDFQLKTRTILKHAIHIIMYSKIVCCNGINPICCKLHTHTALLSVARHLACWTVNQRLYRIHLTLTSYQHIYYGSYNFNRRLLGPQRLNTTVMIKVLVQLSWLCWKSFGINYLFSAFTQLVQWEDGYQASTRSTVPKSVLLSKSYLA